MGRMILVYIRFYNIESVFNAAFIAFWSFILVSAGFMKISLRLILIPSKENLKDQIKGNLICHYKYSLNVNV